MIVCVGRPWWGEVSPVVGREDWTVWRMVDSISYSQSPDSIIHQLTLSIYYSLLHQQGQCVQCSVFSVQFSVFSFQCSVFSPPLNILLLEMTFDTNYQMEGSNIYDITINTS